jgi:hypothetical protein
MADVAPGVLVCFEVSSSFPTSELPRIWGSFPDVLLARPLFVPVALGGPPRCHFILVRSRGSSFLVSLPSDLGRLTRHFLTPCAFVSWMRTRLLSGPGRCCLGVLIWFGLVSWFSISDFHNSWGSFPISSAPWFRSRFTGRLPRAHLLSF